MRKTSEAVVSGGRMNEIVGESGEAGQGCLMTMAAAVVLILTTVAGLAWLGA